MYRMSEEKLMSKKKLVSGEGKKKYYPEKNNTSLRKICEPNSVNN